MLSHSASLLQYVLPSALASKYVSSVLPVSTADLRQSVTNNIVHYLHTITLELHQKLLVLPAAGVIRSANQLMSYLYIHQAGGGQPVVEDGKNKSPAAPSAPDRKGGPASASVSPMPIHHLEPFDHVVKAFDTSMYWTVKADLITNMVGPHSHSQSHSQGSDPLHHFHLSNDVKQLEMLFELGIHDAYYHHNELAEFFDMVI